MARRGAVKNASAAVAHPTVHLAIVAKALPENVP